jgi:hypothetical protein
MREWLTQTRRVSVYKTKPTSFLIFTLKSWYNKTQIFRSVLNISSLQLDSLTFSVSFRNCTIHNHFFVTLSNELCLSIGLPPDWLTYLLQIPILTDTNMVFWNGTPCSLVDTCQHSRGTCSVRLRSRRLFYSSNLWLKYGIIFHNCQKLSWHYLLLEVKVI